MLAGMACWTSIRGPAKTALSGIAVLLAACYLVNAWYWLDWSRPSTRWLSVSCSGGAVTVSWEPDEAPLWFGWQRTGLHTGTYDVKFYRYEPVWLPRWNSSAYAKSMTVPIWIPLAICAVPAASLWIKDWRGKRRPGVCRCCGYDRCGLAPDAKCPECGAVPAPAAK